jgi:hypothetical protein
VVFSELEQCYKFARPQRMEDTASWRNGTKCPRKPFDSALVESQACSAGVYQWFTASASAERRQSRRKGQKRS